MKFMEGRLCFSCAFLVGEVKFGVQSRFGSGKWNACADKQDECTSIKGNSALLPLFSLLSLFSFLYKI